MSSLGHAWKTPVPKQSLSLGFLFVCTAQHYNYFFQLRPLVYSIFSLFYHIHSWVFADWDYTSSRLWRKTVSASIGKFTTIHPSITRVNASVPLPCIYQSQRDICKGKSTLQWHASSLGKLATASVQWFLEHTALTQVACFDPGNLFLCCNCYLASKVTSRNKFCLVTS